MWHEKVIELYKLILVSKFRYNKTIWFCNISCIEFCFLIYLKFKRKYFILLYILLAFIFFAYNKIIEYILCFKSVNLVSFRSYGKKSILILLKNFMYMYYATFDSFTIEYKLSAISNYYCCLTFFKFPLLEESIGLFIYFDYFVKLLNNYKFQLKVFYKNTTDSLNIITLFHILKFPILI